MLFLSRWVNPSRMIELNYRKVLKKRIWSSTLWAPEQRYAYVYCSEVNSSVRSSPSPGTKASTLAWEFGSVKTHLKVEIDLSRRRVLHSERIRSFSQSVYPVTSADDISWHFTRNESSHTSSSHTISLHSDISTTHPKCTRSLWILPAAAAAVPLLKHLIIVPRAPLISSYRGSLLTHFLPFNCLVASHSLS